MLVEAQVHVRGTRAATWAVLSDIEGSARVIAGIDRIEVRERPASGLVGLRWLETRQLFGKPATVEKWITSAEPGRSYETMAASDGFVFVTTVVVADGADGRVLVTSRHESRPQGLKARVMVVPMRLFFSGVIRKAILADLEDVRVAVEGGGAR